MERNIVYVKHDSDNCECCQDFWGAPVPQARDKESTESDADSGYCSITRSKDLKIPNDTTYDAERPRIVPLIVITPLTDDEQIQHNACIRASILQRNPFAFTSTGTSSSSPTAITSTYPYITTTPPSTTSLIEEEALPSSSRSSASLPKLTAVTLPHASTLRLPEESWSHRLKDTYENRMAWPQYFDIPTVLASTSTSSKSSSSSSPSSPSKPSSYSCSSLLSSTAALRKRASKDAIELHPAALPPVTPRARSTTTGGGGMQSLRKRWSIAGSGVGFGFGKGEGTSSTQNTPTPSASASALNPRNIADVGASVTPTGTDAKQTSEGGGASLKRRSRVTSTRSLSSASASVTSLPSLTTSCSSSSGSSSGGTLSRWASGGGSVAGGAFGKGMRSLKGLYSGAPSSFRMLA